jgi:DNA (cytosine-5)-methyltransferase 1
MPKQKTVLSLFCGGGGKTQGAIDAGYLPIGAIDYWEPATKAYWQNISTSNVFTKNILDLHPRTFGKPDLIMASPPCPSYSQAKIGAKESHLDILLSLKVAEHVGYLEPAAVVIENVPAYGRSKACWMLCANLALTGYTVEMSVVNAADLGCPQTRKRLIIRAVRPEKAALKPIVFTHNKNGGNGLLLWNGWYAAIKDLIPELPDSILTDRQQAAVLAAGGHQQLIQRIGYYGDKPKSWDGIEPTGTIRASLGEDGKGNKRAHYMDCWAGRKRSDSKNKVGIDAKSITPKALQRLQGLPDSWVLPDDPRLAVRIIGNSVVPIVAQAACESIQYL